MYFTNENRDKTANSHFFGVTGFFIFSIGTSFDILRGKCLGPRSCQYDFIDGLGKQCLVNRRVNPTHQ